MQMTINVPDTLPAEFLKLRIQELEQNLISEAKFFADFTAWDETKYLLSSPANAQRLLHSLAQVRNGQ
jgi:PHD/YefM family antitoxin component YafN of YafNO toxin-antitoxin module